MCTFNKTWYEIDGGVLETGCWAAKMYNLTWRVYFLKTMPTFIRLVFRQIMFVSSQFAKGGEANTNKRFHSYTCQCQVGLTVCWLQSMDLHVLFSRLVRCDRTIPSNECLPHSNKLLQNWTTKNWSEVLKISSEVLGGEYDLKLFQTWDLGTVRYQRQDHHWANVMCMNNSHDQPKRFSLWELSLLSNVLTRRKCKEISRTGKRQTLADGLLAM